MHIISIQIYAQFILRQYVPISSPIFKIPAHLIDWLRYFLKKENVLCSKYFSKGNSLEIVSIYKNILLRAELFTALGKKNLLIKNVH